MALFYMDEFESAKAAFESFLSHPLCNSDSFVGRRAREWVRKCDAEIEGARQGTVCACGLSRALHPLCSWFISLIHTAVEDGGERGSSASAPEKKAAAGAGGSGAPAMQPPRAYKGRRVFEWYETQDYVVVTFMVRQVQREGASARVEVEQGRCVLVVHFPVEGKEPYEARMPLKGPVKTDNASIGLLVKPVNVEVKLHKERPGHWSELQAPSSTTPVLPVHEAQTEAAPEAAAPSVAPRPMEKWDELSREVLKEEEEETPEGEEALQKLFRQIYRNADDATRRAMNKSFVR